MRTILKNMIVWGLRVQAKAVLKKYRPKIVAVAGSVGKTSTKDAIFAVLSRGHRVRKSEKSFNSEVGLPLTVLGVPNAWHNPFGWLRNFVDGFFLIVFDVRYPEWLVLEVGADRPGDIRSLAGWLPVDIAVITRLPEVPVHVEFFDSPEALMEEKAALIDALKPLGTLVLNGDDELTRALEHRLPAPDARILTFGFNEDNDVRGEEFEMLYEKTERFNLEERSFKVKSCGFPIGMTGRVRVGERSIPVEIAGTVGAHAFLPLLAAAAVGRALGKDMESIAEGLAGYEPPPGRMRLLRGLKNTLIIDDSYNASPAAALAALDTLASIDTKRKIVVQGDMTELGRHSIEQHKKIGARVAQVANLLITVGFRARDIAESALDNGMPDSNILQFEDSQKAGKELETLLQPGDLVLIKGSAVMRMERAVEEVMLEPERAGELLVRQDAEWRKR